VQLPVSQDLWRITGADLIVRTAYQVGKTPLMPLFAASVGAGELLVGAIVSVSTMTGLILKPLFGLLSDRWGRRLWLLIGLTLFSTIPFVYGLVETPQQLLMVRVIHGLATAVFGPVSRMLLRWQWVGEPNDWGGSAWHAAAAIWSHPPLPPGC